MSSTLFHWQLCSILPFSVYATDIVFVVHNVIVINAKICGRSSTESIQRPPTLNAGLVRCGARLDKIQRSEQNAETNVLTGLIGRSQQKADIHMSQYSRNLCRRAAFEDNKWNSVGYVEEDHVRIYVLLNNRTTHERKCTLRAHAFNTDARAHTYTQTEN